MCVYTVCMLHHVCTCVYFSECVYTFSVGGCMCVGVGGRCVCCVDMYVCRGWGRGVCHIDVYVCRGWGTGVCHVDV